MVVPNQAMFGFIVLLPNEILLNKDTDKCTCTLIIKERFFEGIHMQSRFLQILLSIIKFSKTKIRINTYTEKYVLLVRIEAVQIRFSNFPAPSNLMRLGLSTDCLSKRMIGDILHSSNEKKKVVFFINIILVVFYDYSTISHTYIL